MSVLHTNFLDAAASFAKGDHEIDWRNAVSRCYYAAYHLAEREAHFCPPTDNPNTGAHAQLARRFALSKSHDGPVIAQALLLMKREREKSDYNIGLSVPQSDAHDQLAKYHQFARRMISFSTSKCNKA